MCSSEAKNLPSNKSESVTWSNIEMVGQCAAQKPNKEFQVLMKISAIACLSETIQFQNVSPQYSVLGLMWGQKYLPTLNAWGAAAEWELMEGWMVDVEGPWKGGYGCGGQWIIGYCHACHVQCMQDVPLAIKKSESFQWCWKFVWTLTPALSEPVTSIAVTSYPSSTVKHSEQCSRPCSLRYSCECKLVTWSPASCRSVVVVVSGH